VPSSQQFGKCDFTVRLDFVSPSPHLASFFSFGFVLPEGGDGLGQCMLGPLVTFSFFDMQQPWYISFVGCPGLLFPVVLADGCDPARVRPLISRRCHFLSDQRHFSAPISSLGIILSVVPKNPLRRPPSSTTSLFKGLL